MKVILTTNIKKLGKIGELVNVKDGHARNYLLPKKKALRNTKSNLDYYEKIKEDIISKEKEKLEKAKQLLENAKKLNIEFSKEADDKDQLYGTVSKKEILNFLSEKNIKIQSDDIKIINPIKSIGNHEIELNPYEGVVDKVNIVVKKN